MADVDVGLPHAQRRRWSLVKKGIRWLRLVGSFRFQISFAKEPNKRDYILQMRPIIWARGGKAHRAEGGGIFGVQIPGGYQIFRLKFREVVPDDPPTNFSPPSLVPILMARSSFGAVRPPRAQEPTNRSHPHRRYHVVTTISLKNCVVPRVIDRR